MDRQAIHMDQGLAWCPEFRATRSMSDYPSRKAQLVRALHLGETPPSARAAEILFHSILSFQGERWQVFGEPPAGLTSLLILGRHALRKAGFGRDPVEEETGHRGASAQEQTARGAPADPDGLDIPATSGGSDWLHVDAACARAAAPGARRLAAFLGRAGVRLGWRVRPVSGLWELFARGALEEGAARARSLVGEREAAGVRRIATLEGKEAWLWRYFLPEVGVRHRFEVRDVLEQARRIETDPRTFIHAGSFRARALDQCGLVNRLAARGGAANRLTIWQRPICAEHEPVGIPPETERLIFEDAREEIRASGCRRIVVFGARAYGNLRAAGTAEEVIYFVEALA